MANTIRKNPTMEYSRANKGAGGRLSGLITLQQSLAVSLSATATGQFNFGWRVPQFCDAGKVYRVGIHAWKNGNTLTEAWHDGVGDLTVTTVKVDKWTLTGGALTTIASKGDWLSSATTPTNLVSCATISAGFGITVAALDGQGYWELNRENAPTVFTVSQVAAGDFIRMWVTLTNGTNGAIVPFVTGFLEIDQIYP